MVAETRTTALAAGWMIADPFIGFHKGGKLTVKHILPYRDLQFYQLISSIVGSSFGVCYRFL